MKLADEPKTLPAMIHSAGRGTIMDELRGNQRRIRVNQEPPPRFVVGHPDSRAARHFPRSQRLPDQTKPRLMGQPIPFETVHPGVGTNEVRPC